MILLPFHASKALTPHADWQRSDLAGNVATIAFLKIGYCHMISDLEVSEVFVHIALHYRSTVTQSEAQHVIRSCLHS